MGTPRVLSARIDALTIRFRVAFSEALQAALRDASKRATKHGRVAFHFEAAGLHGELRYSRNQRRWCVKNPAFRVYFDPGSKRRGGEPGFTFEIVWYAQALAERAPGDVRRRSIQLAAGMGRLFEARLGRIDLCADVEDWTLAENQVPFFVKRPRSFAKEHVYDAKWVEELQEEGELLPEADDEGIVKHYTKFVTGFSFSPGGPLMARIYNKPEELRIRAEEKRRAEEDRWRAAGWDGVKSVTRVEFQIRGEALRDFGLTDPERAVEWTKDGKTKRAVEHRVLGGFENAVDRVWLACLSWLRFTRETEADGERAARRELAEEWKALYQARFFRKADGVQRRVRVRGGATVEQQLGCTLSVLGAADKLTREEARGGGFQVTSDGMARTVLRARLRSLHERVVDVDAERLEEVWGSPRAALEHVTELVAATWARFADADGEGQQGVCAA